MASDTVQTNKLQASNSISTPTLCLNGDCRDSWPSIDSSSKDVVVSYCYEKTSDVACGEVDRVTYCNPGDMLISSGYWFAGTSDTTGGSVTEQGGEVDAPYVLVPIYNNGELACKIRGSQYGDVKCYYARALCCKLKTA